VASVAEIHAQALLLLERPGLVLIMKGRYPVDELADPALAGLDLAARPLRVPTLDGERHLIEIRHD
jgi:16S rRNA (guanine527-N7)-methyltransferase